MSLQFNIARNSSTGAALKQEFTHAGGRHATTQPRGVVCYGAPYRGPLPSLNARAGTFDKLQELQTLHTAHVAAIPVVDPQRPEFPLLARLRHHTKGKDIIPVLGPLEFQWVQRIREFYTKYIAPRKEFRVWVFRANTIGTYEKVLARPQEYKQFGCNYNNGFAFQHREMVRECSDLAVGALRALGLDFGAVDILQGQDNNYYVLEVNTAPGTEQGVLGRLAAKLKEWEEQGCPGWGEVVQGRRRCETCQKYQCLCQGRRERRAFACCGKRRCECQRVIR